MRVSGGADGSGPVPAGDAISGVRMGAAGPEFSSAAIRQLFEHIPVAVSVTTGREHRFAYANRHYRRALLHDLADPVERDLASVFGGRLAAENYGLRDRALAERRAHSAKESPVAPFADEPETYWDVTYFPLLDEAGAGAGILTFAVDVTEKVAARRLAERQAEDEHARAEEASFHRERLALAVEATGLGIWEWNVTTGVTHWSDRQKEIWGLSPQDEASYDYWRASLHPEDRDLVLTTVQGTLDPASGGHQQLEHRIVLPDGRVRWVASRGRMIYEAGTGRPLRLIGTVLDVTSRKNADHALREALTSKEILLREVNHRVKNSLQLVSSMLALQGGRSSHPEVRRVVQEAQSRLQVVAAVHERLYRSEDIRSVELDVFLETLCRDVERTMVQADERIAVEVVTRAGNHRKRPRNSRRAHRQRASDERDEICLSRPRRDRRGEPSQAHGRQGLARRRGWRRRPARRFRRAAAAFARLPHHQRAGAPAARRHPYSPEGPGRAL